MKDELTLKQIRRQDKVDNNIRDLVESLIPEGYGGEYLEYDINWISSLRSRIQNIIIDELGIQEVDQDDFEMAFYPYLNEDD
ncbi:MAG: hypothetical protein LH629_00505 [Ignavibacteria bacterium]|nr:hypothetical protein [Ignavibacteria bacterium]